MKPFPKLPNPHPDHAGRNFVERKSKEAFSRIAKLWQPSGEENETTHSTVSRYAQYLIDRITGKAYSADEIMVPVIVRTTAEGAPINAVKNFYETANGGGGNKDIRFEQVDNGSAPTVVLSLGGISTPLSVEVSSRTITVTCPTAIGQITTTAAAVISAINANGAASSILTASNKTGSNGSEAMALSVGPWVLSGGSSGTEAMAVGQLCRVGDASPFEWYRWDSATWGELSSDVAAAIAAAASKAIPVDADEFAITDSAASGVLKRLSWANIKATLKLYFDTLYVAVTQLSTNGGANKVARFDSSAYFRTGAVNDTGADPGGGLRIPTYQRITWDDNTGTAVANVWMFHNHGSSHDANTYPELVWSAARHCYYWDDGFQMGNSTSGPGQRGWRFLYFNPLGQACPAGTSLGGTLDTQMESVATIFGSEMWDGSQRMTSYGAAQYIATGAGAGKLTFWTGGTTTPGGTSARGRILASSGYNNSLTLNNNGPIIPAGKTLQAESDLTVTQNSAVTIQSDQASALANTIRITNGKVRVGASQSYNGGAAFPFEVAPNVAGISQTTGDLYVDTNGTVYVGRLSTTSGGGNGKQIWQGRTGVAQMTFDAGGTGTTPTATFASLVTSTNTTDATSSAGAIKTSGGVSAEKGIYLGTVLTGTEQASEPAAPAANGFVIYAIDNGSGKTKLMAKFATGAAQQLAIEP